MSRLSGLSSGNTTSDLKLYYQLLENLEDTGKSDLAHSLVQSRRLFAKPNLVKLRNYDTKQQIAPILQEGQK